MKKAFLAVLLSFPMIAYAHGDASWIMNNLGLRPGDTYRNLSDSNHCCGPNDCMRMTLEEVHQYITITETDILVGEPYNIRIPKRKITGLYFSIDQDFWWCRWGNKIQCLFIPGEPKS